LADPGAFDIRAGFQTFEFDFFVNLKIKMIMALAMPLGLYRQD
jgi:hypothetical protein